MTMNPTANRDETRRDQNLRPERVRDVKSLSLGIDVGSTSSDIVLIDVSSRVVISDYRRTLGQPLETVQDQLQNILSGVNLGELEYAAATGSAGRLVAKLLNIPFVNEVPAQTAAIYHLYPRPKDATIIEMGGQDSKLIFMTVEEKAERVRDFALNTSAPPAQVHF